MDQLSSRMTVYSSQLVLATKIEKYLSSWAHISADYSPLSDRGTRRRAAALQAAAPQRRPERGAERSLGPRTGSRGWGLPRRPRSCTSPCGCPTHCPRCGPREGAGSSPPPRSRTPPLSRPHLNRHRPGQCPHHTSWIKTKERDIPSDMVKSVQVGYQPQLTTIFFILSCVYWKYVLNRRFLKH